jgi:hypothetical protein
MYGELGYAAAYFHLFYVLSCVERYVDCSRHKLIHPITQSRYHDKDIIRRSLEFFSTSQYDQQTHNEYHNSIQHKNLLAQSIFLRCLYSFGYFHGVKFW